MSLSRLENFLKNAEGNILYVNPSDFDSTDGIENQGNSLTRPFKTIQRALLEASRFSYQQGRNNDKVDRTTILIYPGVHYIDNRPGFAVLKDPSNPNAAIYKRRTGKYDWVTDTSLIEFGTNTNYDILDTYNDLYKFNSINGGVILPRGTSIVGLDLRKTKIRPLYVPDPENNDIDASSIFNLTGSCYINSFTIFDSDVSTTAFKDYSFSRYIPRFSHHKLSAFSYSDGINLVSVGSQQTDLTDLQMYYFKVAKVFSTIGDYPSTIDFEPSIDEFRIVGPTFQNSLGISSIVSSSSGIVTVTTTNLQTRLDQPHNFYVDSPVLISGITVDDASYNGSFTVKDVVGLTTFTYVTSNPPSNYTLSESNYINAQVSVENDTVSSASPYIFNCTLRSVYGMSGLIADGNKTDGFKSAVVAQFTAISLQKDDNAFILYDTTTGQFKSSSEVEVSQRPLYRNSNAIYKPAYENSHIKVLNNAFVQAVSVFAIGFSKQFVTESGGDLSITNSNSNFGAVALESSGFKNYAFQNDDTGYITHIIPPKEIFSNEVEVSWISLDAEKIVSVGDTSKLYLYGYNDVNIIPPYKIDAYRIGAKTNEVLNLTINVGTAQTNYQSPILMPVPSGSGIAAKKVYTVDRVGSINNISSDTITLTSNHQLFNGEKVRVFSDTGKGPDGIELNKVYYAIVDGVGASQLKLANSYSDSISTPPNPISNIKQTGGVLSVISSVTDKIPGETGHPIQYDLTNSNWYVVGSASSETNRIYNAIVGIGTAIIGKQTASTFITRKFDNRSIDDRIYMIRYVIPKEFANARPPQPGFIIQESSSTSPGQLSFNTNSLSNSIQLRNDKIIVDAYTDSVNNGNQKVTIVTELPHNLFIGDKVKIKNLLSSNNPTGTGSTSNYNGSYEVLSIPNSRSFTYNISGIGTNPGSIVNYVNERDTVQEITALPYFSREEYENSYFIYRTNTIQSQIPGSNGRDGIYHLIVLSSNVSIDDNIGYGLSSKNYNQDIRNLYPQVDRDNFNSDPAQTVSTVDLMSIGNVITDDKKKSITKETINSFIKNTRIGFGITGVSVSGVGNTTITLYTDIDHGLNSIKSLNISNAGSGYGSTTLYASPLVGSAGTDAIVRATLSSGSISSVTVIGGGSGYSVGSALTITPPKGIIPTVNSTVIVNEINNNTGDGLELSGFYQEDLNGVFRIINVPSSKSIVIHKPNGLSGYSSNTSGVLPVAIVASKGIGITSFRFDDVKTGIVTVTTSLSHGLLQGNKFTIVGSGHTIYDNSFIVNTVVGINTFTFNIGIVSTTKSSTTGTLLKNGISANGGDSSFDESEIGSRYSYIYAGISTTLSTGVSVSDSTISLTDSNGFIRGDYILLNSEIIRLASYSSGNQFSVIRGQFSTRKTIAQAGTLVKKIKVIPVEVRRPSFMRASNHTFEYVGFGPGNYSTGFPSRQNRTLSDDNIITSQARKENGGTVVYTGMNDIGEFYSGTKKVSSTTGEEKVVDAPIITFTGDDTQGQVANRLSGIFDDVLVKERIVIEGGSSNTQSSQFYGPVDFTKKLTNISDDGILVRNLSIKGLGIDRPKIITMGIGTPTTPSDRGNISLVPEPSQNLPYIGNVYLSNGWRRFGLISQESDKLSFKVDKLGIGNTGTNNNLTFDYTNQLEVNGTAKIANLIVDDFQVAGEITIANPKFTNIDISETINYLGIGVTYTQIHNSGVSKLYDLNVVGISSFVGSISLENLLFGKSAKFNNIGIATVNNNTINTYSGGLILDSASGITTISDTLNVVGNETIYGDLIVNSGILTTIVKDSKTLQVGIGTTGSIPYNSSLELYDGNNVGFSIVRSSSGVSTTTTLTHIGTSNYVLNAQNSSDFIIKTNNIERINVSSGGTITYKQNNSGKALGGSHFRLNQDGPGDVALSWFITNNNLNRRWYAGIDTSDYSWKLATPELSVAEGSESFATANETKLSISTGGNLTLLGDATLSNATLSGSLNVNGGISVSQNSTFSQNISIGGTITVSGGSGGPALTLRNGGDLVFYNSNNTGISALFCDTDNQLKTNNNILANSYIKSNSTGVNLSTIGGGYNLGYTKTSLNTGIGTYNFLRADGSDGPLTTSDFLNYFGYIPQPPVTINSLPSGNSLVLDDFSSGFNGTTNIFNLSFSETSFTPVGPYNLIVVLNGVVKKASADYNIVQSGGNYTNQIQFTTAPTAGTSCFIIALGGQGSLKLNQDWTAAGQIIAATGVNNATTIPVGNNGELLTVDTTLGPKIKWSSSINISGSITGSSLNVGSGSITSGSIAGTSLSVGSGSITSGNVTSSGIISATSFVGNGITPVGGIIMWSGTIVQAQALVGWKLCDGTNGTPDLRNRFIVGAGNNYIPGDTGGADSVTLTTNQIPSHTHFTVANDTSPASQFTSNVTSTSAMSKGTGASNLNEAYNLINSGISATLSPTSSTGSGNSHENRPPYYALAFIMRTA